MGTVQLPVAVPDSRLARDAIELIAASSPTSIVWDSIALHTTPGIPQHKEPEVAPVTAGVELDVLGLGYDDTSAEARHAVLPPAHEGLEHDRRRGRCAEVIAGYTCFNEESLRGYQRHALQWTVGKNLDRTSGFGPPMVTPDELPPSATGLGIECRLIGTLVNRVEDEGR